MIRQAMHRMAQHAAAGPALLRAPLTPLLERFSGGDRVDLALQTASGLTNEGFSISLERSAPMLEPSQDIAALLIDLEAVIAGVAALGLGPVTEVCVYAHALGLMSPGDSALVEEQLILIIKSAQQHDIAVMLGAGAPDLVETNLDLARNIMDMGLPLGITLQAALRRTERDCRDFQDGAIRLVKGAYHVSGGAVFTSAAEVDKSFVRCAKVLIRREGSISFATHDERIIRVLQRLLDEEQRSNVEFAFFLGRHPVLQQRMLSQGWPVRVYVPFGPEWFTRLVDAYAERPASLASALRSIVSGG